MLAYPFSDHRDSVGSFPTNQGGIDLNVFEAVKQSVTTRQAAEHYGIHVGRNGMACCPFHNDKTPSMKLDQRYHCFGCGADGLGTPATRAGIIEGLILKGLVERKDKNLIPTKKGI